MHGRIFYAFAENSGHAVRNGYFTVQSVHCAMEYFYFCMGFAAAAKSFQFARCCRQLSVSRRAESAAPMPHHLHHAAAEVLGRRRMGRQIAPYNSCLHYSDFTDVCQALIRKHWRFHVLFGCFYKFAYLSLCNLPYLAIRSNSCQISLSNAFFHPHRLLNLLTRD